MVVNRHCVYLIVFSVLLHIAGYIVLFNKIWPFLFYFYVCAWWSYILFIDAILAIKTKRFLIFNKHLPLLIIISCGFWCFFEIINVRLQNWFYVNVPEELFLRYSGYVLAYGTVMPAIYITKEMLETLFGRIVIKPFFLGRYARYSICIGIIIFLLIWFFPDYLFPSTWIFLALILDGFNYRKGYRSFIKDMEEGDATCFVCTIVSGLICGVLWETWNAFSITKWVYSVPFFEDVKIFEMPVPGYIGFLVFGLETITFINLLEGIRSDKLYAFVAVFVSIALSVITFKLIDRYTVFSFATHIKDIQCVGKEKLEYMKVYGIKTTFEIDNELLNAEEKKALELIHLKGLGWSNYSKLKSHGVDNIEALSRLSDKDLSEILDEKNLRRVRVYLKAAKKAGVQDSRGQGEIKKDSQ